MLVEENVYCGCASFWDWDRAATQESSQLLGASEDHCLMYIN